MFLREKQMGSSLGVQAFLLPIIIIALGIGANMFYLYTIRGHLQRLANDAAHIGLSQGRDFSIPVSAEVDFMDEDKTNQAVTDYINATKATVCGAGQERCTIKMENPTPSVWVNHYFSSSPASVTLDIHHVSNAPFCNSREADPCTADRQLSAVDSYTWVNNTPAVAVYFEAEIPSPIPLIGDNGIITAHLFGESALYSVDENNFQEALPWEN